VAGYADFNRGNWDERAPAHAASPDYAFDRFLADPGFLSAVIRFDLPRLRDVAGLRGVHLQCHVGTDTISLARLGARMTGLDLSPASLQQARWLNEQTGDGVEFVEAELYDAVSVLGAGRFDFVYTGVGALCWLPSIVRWAQVVSELLVPAGRLFIREGHPVLWSLSDERDDDLLAVEYPYFEREAPTVSESSGTYVETDATFVETVTHQWNHGLGEIVTALMEAGMALTMLEEHDSAPWDAFPGQSEMVAPREWRLADRPWRIPQTYTLQAVKRT
jgi:SAM-dependent methyltransferase